MRIYYLYQNLPKRLRELISISESYEKSVRKPSKSYVTRWFEHKFTAMQSIFDKYDAQSHLVKLAVTQNNVMS